MITQTIGANSHPNLIRPGLSPISFSTRKVDVGKLLRLIEAARWTHSYGNEQPWSFIIASKDDPSAHERLLSCLAESNIAKDARAPVLILSVVKLNFDGTGQRNPYAFYDAGKALANLTSRAGAMGLLVHQISGFDAARARELFRIPSGYAPVSVIAIGYPLTETTTGNSNPAGVTARTRRPLQNLVFTGSWGEAYSLLAGAAPDPCDERDDDRRSA